MTDKLEALYGEPLQNWSYHPPWWRRRNPYNIEQEIHQEMRCLNVTSLYFAPILCLTPPTEEFH